ncbi:MAG: hypothetical protein WC781_05120 [Candidatus Pacearchaeota archaeon]|jgi:hypothetical protein
MNKKGAAHVEIIISATIFIVFLMFLFVLLNPFKKTVSDEVINTAYININEMVKTNFSSVSINLIEDNELIDKIKLKGCFSINTLSDIDCSENRKIIVKNESGSIINSNIIDGKILIEYSEKDRYYTIYCSNEIELHENGINLCQYVESSQYVLGSIRLKEVWSEKKLNLLNETYYNQYTSLKEKVVPQGTEFSILITDINGNVKFNLLKNVPKGIDVKARQIPIDKINKDANVTKEVLRILIW